MPAIDNDFSRETVQDLPLLASQAKNWNIVATTADTWELVDGDTQAVELAPGDNSVNSAAWLAYLTAPASVHQSAELKISRGSTRGSSATMGVFLRLQDSSNFVALIYDVNLNRVRLIQRLGGTYNTLASPTVAGNLAALGVSVKLEVIGTRARWWFNPSFYECEDVPPDGAVNLLGPVPSSPGEWGIISQSNNTNADFHGCHFVARELPNVALPPPSVIANVASGYNFVPITIDASAITDALKIEWEVAPVDSDDFAEAYRDFTLGTTTSRTAWVRAGYTYEVRARGVNSSGELAKWTPAQRITANGTKVFPTSPVLPDDEFPDITPDYVLPYRQATDVTAVLTGTMREHLSSTFIRPRGGWTLVFDNRLADEMKLLTDFFDDCDGRTRPFKWVHPTSGQQFCARFDMDELEVTTIDPGQTTAIMRAEVNLIEAFVGVLDTLDLNLTIDPNL